MLYIIELLLFSVESPQKQHRELSNWLPSCHHSYKQLPVVHSFLPELPSKHRDHHLYNTNVSNSNDLNDEQMCNSYYVVTHNHISQTTIRAIPRSNQNSATILRSPQVCRHFNDDLMRTSMNQVNNKPPLRCMLNYKESLNKTRVRVSDTWDDDVTTTTSGSYVVDADDLWQYPE